jgi:formylglycine-generating enzyme required for sulfatase activity
MHGNVWEWCQDAWHENYLGAPSDGSARQPIPESGPQYAVIRGGSWDAAPFNCRADARRPERTSWGGYDFGFRLAAF